MTGYNKKKKYANEQTNKQKKRALFTTKPKDGYKKRFIQ